MPADITIGVKESNLRKVSRAFAVATGNQGKGHESTFLGEYDLFRIPEEVRVRRNYVPIGSKENDPDDEWEYPQFKEYEVLIEVDSSSRPGEIIKICENMGFQVKTICCNSY